MSHDDPETRHLTRDELARVLDSARESECLDAVCEAKTTVFRRPERTVREHRAEPATQLEIAPRRASGIRASSPSREIATLAGARKPFVSPTVTTRVGIGLLVAGCAWWVGLSSPSNPNTRLAPPAIASLRKREAVSALAASSQARQPALEIAPATVHAHSPPDTQAPSARTAVDLLLSGRMRDALDAYRALALNQPEQAAYAAVVTQLEWELADCEREGRACAR